MSSKTTSEITWTVALFVAVLLIYCTNVFGSGPKPSDLSSVSTELNAAKSWLLFEIRKDQQIKGFVFGSSHISIGDIEIPNKVTTALQASDSLTFEANTFFDKEMQPETLNLLTTNEAHKPIKDVLRPTTYKLVEELIYLTKFPEQNRHLLEYWSPFMAIAALSTECTKMNLKGTPPDTAILGFAMKNKIEVTQGLENVQEQLGWIRKLSASEWHEYISAYSTWIKNKNCNYDSSKSMTTVINAFLNGEADALVEEYLRFYSQAIPIEWFQKKYLLTARNYSLAEKIEQITETGKKTFFSVGAVHLGGPNGILNLLRNKNYEIIQR